MSSIQVVSLLFLGLFLPVLIVAQLELCATLVKDLELDQFKVGSKRMLMLHRELSWHDAKKDCETRGLRLLTLSTKEENEALRDYFNIRIWGTGPVADIIHWYLWTSGTDAETEGTWKWATTGRNFTHSTWLSKDEPNGGDKENCMELRMVAWDHCLWNDANCESKKRYICEIEETGLEKK